MDAKAFGRLKRGKLVPEARIDLHGLTLDAAHSALIQFVLSAQSRGLRLVLVITGKGNREDPFDPVPQRRGALKRQAPLWLQQMPLAGAVLQVSEAHVRHGGSGAYYVYLRKRR
ncbi:Smr/MutS family protein [Thalassococcus arenae]